VDTLVRDPQSPADETPAALPPQEPVAPEAPQAVARTCESCGTDMAAGQDWCLECGTAAPGRLGRRPGLRAAATVVGLTIALVAGAVTAGYAAISSDAGRDVAAPPAAAATPIAQAPPSTPAAPAPVAPAAQLPKVSPPKTATPPPPVHSTPAPPPVSTPSTPPATGTPSTTPSTPADNAPQAIDLGADAASLYDPYTRASDEGDTADAYDGDPTTAYSVSATADGQDMQLGLVVDLAKKRTITDLRLRTSTPGFRMELYAADTKQLPPDILDTRWAHLKNRSDVAKNEKVTGLAPDGHKYRYVLVWLTTPPKAGPTVKINELKLLG
jgi:outer membrane biosynthesis protein TonB